MALSDFIKDIWWIQGYVKIPTGYPPPDDFVYDWGDNIDIKGAFVIDKSSAVRVAEAQGMKTIGNFYCGYDPTHPGNPPENNDILRNESNNQYIRLTGLPDVTPGVSDIKIRIFPAEVTTKPNNI